MDPQLDDGARGVVVGEGAMAFLNAPGKGKLILPGVVTDDLGVLGCDETAGFVAFRGRGGTGGCLTGLGAAPRGVGTLTVADVFGTLTVADVADDRGVVAGDAKLLLFCG